MQMHKLKLHEPCAPPSTTASTTFGSLAPTAATSSSPSPGRMQLGLSGRSLTRTLSYHFSTRMPSSSANQPIVLCGPSGVGKSTLLKRLLTEFPGEYGFSVSHTTRSPRPGEEAGVHYHYVSKSDFQSLVSEGAFLEYATFGDNMYGTTAKAVQEVSSSNNQRAILDIDAQGVKLLKQNHSYLNPLYLFISPPDLQSLYTRLKSRGTETPSSILKRLSMARGEMAYAREGNGKQFDVVVVNDDIEKAYKLFRGAIRDGVTKGDTIPQDQQGEEERVLQEAQRDLQQQQPNGNHHP
ncbi:unnamed protein product [Sympodiomycopsis kandeliae]